MPTGRHICLDVGMRFEPYIALGPSMTMHDSAIWYGANSPPLRDKLAHDAGECEKEISRHFGQEAELARKILDSSYEVASHFSWCLNAPHIAQHPANLSVLFAAFHKGLFTLSSCLDLTCKGLYGPARPLLRHAFEFLVIAKFCSVHPKTKVYESWRDGRVVYFSNGILKKINTPDVQPLADLWQELSEMTHATSSSSQVGLYFPLIAAEVQINLALIRVLCDWLAHLLNQHIITPSMRYATERHTPAKPALKSAKQRLAQDLKASRSMHSKDSARLITCFRRKWLVSA
jgi:hypothetical protein